MPCVGADYVYTLLREIKLIPWKVFLIVIIVKKLMTLRHPRTRLSEV